MQPPATSFPRLVGDIGGTHARFATIAQADAALTDFSAHDCRDFTGLDALLLHRLGTATGPRPSVAALGVATPVTGDVVRMTNLDWQFSVAHVQQSSGLDRVLVVNDFEILARALPTLHDEELHHAGGGPAVPGAALAVLGPGTGLGVAGLSCQRGSWWPVVGEGGHVSLAAEDDLEDRVLQRLRTRFGHVSAERVLSGAGLVHLHDAIRSNTGSDAETLAPADVTRRALDGSDADCRRAVMMFLGWLGAVAGDLALTLGARGGVYVGGGIVAQLLPLLPESDFRSRFEGKGRFAAYAAAIPTWVITDASAAALRGASMALDA